MNKTHSAFFGDESIKGKYVKRMKDHIAADELIRGTGFEKGKGCAVGCTLDKYEHKAYETELGIPEWISCVEDNFFERMNFDKSKNFPLIFLESINVGSDLNKIKAPFLIYILENTLDKFDNYSHTEVVKSINRVIDLYKDKNSTQEEFNHAANAAANVAANVAAYAANVAANVAAYAAYAAYAYAANAYDASNAADAAADAAAYAAGAVSDAAYAADAVSDAAYAADAAYKKTYDKFADKLIDLIKECK